ncbi:MAG: elongation factor G, partial [Acidobacteria bacterium]|nr:elongation factor G [Acidobacteriota bacterium]
MKIYESKDIRNLALAGHGDTGKTSLTAAMLHNAGITNRLTRVDDGNTVTDYDAEEVKRKISLSTGLCYFERNKKKVNVLDTPGYGNFFPESRGSFRVCDVMAFMVCGVSGVEVQTEKAWKIARELKRPGIFI